MIKTLKIALLVASCPIIAQTNYNYSISGTLKNLKDNSYIYLHHKWNNKDFTDSSKVKAGKFSFTGKGNEPNMYWITKSANIAEQPNLIFFVDGGKMAISGNADSIQAATVTGGQSQKDYTEYTQMMNGYTAKQQAIIGAYNEAKSKNDQVTMQNKYNEYQALDKEVKTAVIEFIKKHPKSAVSGYAIYYNYQNANVTVEELQAVVGLLDKSILKTKYGKLGQEKLNQILGTTVGYPALDFSQASPEGKMISLSELKGKYVLLDFWASWCGPCRQENPNVVAAFNKYKDKGFTVFGVSLDQNKERWLGAIKSDNLTWTHVSDLKGWGNEVAKMYGISSIPQNLLLDKDGKIIAKNLRGPDLDAKLAEIVK